MSVMKVSEIPYRRFTIEEAQEVFSTFEQEMKSATSAAEVLEARKHFRTAMEEASTAQSLANCRFTLDTRNEFYQAENDYYDEVGPLSRRSARSTPI